MNPLRTQRLKFVTMIVLTAKSTVRPVFDLVLFYSLNQEIWFSFNGFSRLVAFGVEYAANPAEENPVTNPWLAEFKAHIVETKIWEISLKKMRIWIFEKYLTTLLNVASFWSSTILPLMSSAILGSTTFKIKCIQWWAWPRKMIRIQETETWNFPSNFSV